MTKNTIFFLMGSFCVGASIPTIKAAVQSTPIQQSQRVAFGKTEEGTPITESNFRELIEKEQLIGATIDNVPFLEEILKGLEPDKFIDLSSSSFKESPAFDFSVLLQVDFEDSVTEEKDWMLKGIKQSATPYCGCKESDHNMTFVKFSNPQFTGMDLRRFIMRGAFFQKCSWKYALLDRDGAKQLGFTPEQVCKEKILILEDVEKVFCGYIRGLASTVPKVTASLILQYYLTDIISIPEIVAYVPAKEQPYLKSLCLNSEDKIPSVISRRGQWNKKAECIIQ